MAKVFLPTTHLNLLKEIKKLLGKKRSFIEENDHFMLSTVFLCFETDIVSGQILYFKIKINTC